MKIHTKIDVAPRRAADYMPLPEQLDAIMKGFAALAAQGVQLPAETLNWIAHCQQVKAAHPKRN
jgi:hypothetical protein